MSAAAYYRGGARVVIDGVPVRLARKPSKANLADMRQNARDREKYGSERYWTKGPERVKLDKRNARSEVERYAQTLGITYRAALRRAAKQARTVEAAPLLDLTLEYDL